jgi:hypothetical protein
MEDQATLEEISHAHELQKFKANKGPQSVFHKKMKHNNAIAKSIIKTIAGRRHLLERCLLIPRVKGLEWRLGSVKEMIDFMAVGKFGKKAAAQRAYDRSMVRMVRESYHIYRTLCPHCGGEVRPISVLRNGMIEVSHALRLMNSNQMESAMLAMAFGLSEELAKDIFSSGSGNSIDCIANELADSAGKFLVAQSQMHAWRPVWRMAK